MKLSIGRRKLKTIQGFSQALTRGAGFTLVEVIVSISIVAVLAGISIPAYSAIKASNNINIAVNTVTHALRHAQAMAQASKGDMSWGVKESNGQVIVFKGLSYESRDTIADKIIDLPARTTFSGLTEVVFSKYYGLPQTTGIISISNGDSIQDITINEKGMVSWRQ